MEIDGVLEPLTPAKPVPARSGHNSQAASTSGRGTEKEIISDEFLCKGSLGTIEYLESNGNKGSSVLGVAGKDPESTTTVQNDTSCIQEEAECDGNKVHGVHESQDGINSVPSVPSPSETKDSRKRRNNGIDLNKKPSQRPRVKKHRPKVYDDSKTKKVPKAKTPKPKTPKPVQERSVHSRKEKFTESTSCMQNSTSYSYGPEDVEAVSRASIIERCTRSLYVDQRNTNHVSKSHEETSCMQNSMNYAIEDVDAASRASITALIPCKRRLDLNHPAEGEFHHVSKSHDKHPSFNFELGELECFRRIVTSKRNTRRRSRFHSKSLEASENLLGDNNKHQCGLDFSIIENLKQTKKHVKRFDYVYRCQKKSSSKISSYNSTLQVYQRKFRSDQCLQSSKKIGPSCPKMFKKKRTMRKKVTINANWRVKFLENGKKKRPLKKRIQTTKSKPNLYTDKCLLPLLVPMKKKRSILHTRRRENLVDIPFFQAVPDYNESFYLCPEENFLQITKCLPLQEVPIYEIENFTSLPPNVQGVENTVGALEWLQSQEVPVFGSQSLIPKQKDSKMSLRKTINSLIKELGKLDINAQCKELVVRNNDRLALAKTKPEKEKEKKVLAKVDLDEESMRVWKIVMENNGSQPFEEMENDKKEWWERQRNIFRGRVDSFIAKMHLIQGNRRFSPWKGSVVDSVVGVYLTQNVSDHLSSSAFMSLAARFPVKSKNKEVVDHDEEVNASQESVQSNTEIYEGFYNNNTVDQNMITSYAEEMNMTPTTQLKQTEATNLQDKSCLDENPKSFRNLLEIDAVGYLKNFYNADESALNEREVQEKSTLEEEESTFEQEKSTLEEEKSKGEETKASNLQDKPCVDENLNTFRKVLDIEEADYLKNYYSINIDKSALNESKVQEKSTLEQEKLTFEQEKSTLEEEPRIVAAVSSLQSEITMEQGVNAVNNHESKKTSKKKSKKEEKEEVKVDWKKFKETYCKNERKEINEDFMDAVDWDEVHRTPTQEIANLIVERGMNNVLAIRIKDFLNRLVNDHGSIDLEWLRDIPPDKAKEFLLSIPGIGLKSVECVRLLTLHHNAFPVDTNVGRVATRLGWVPLQPLPEQLQIHLLNSYPMVDTIQKYLYPRLCTLDKKTLYELHYQLITFGKVFCTKISPNCNACPMRAECRHYASAYASARLALPGPKGSSTVTTIVTAPPPPPPPPLSPLSLPPAELNEWGSGYHVQDCEPIVEVPPSPEPYVAQELPDIEDYFLEADEDEIPTIRLNTEEFRETLKETIDKKNNMVVPEGGEMSKAIVLLTAEAASFRVRPIKIKAKLRTVHIVYELPDYHPSLAGFEEREQEDPSRYLLAIWPETSGCNSSNDTQEETVKGTVLIPCRTANRGKFPLNGTYFQVNEVFADDETSKVPMDIPRHLLWNLPRRDLGCGTSATSIFKGLSTSDIQHIFWRGSICVRGFNRKTRQPRPLHRRFHNPGTVISTGNKKTPKK